MEHDPIYTVTVRGKDFLLTKSQIEFDGPNYFTTCFLGDFKKAQSHHLKLSRDPNLFFIISDYLCGYEVLPLSDQVIPARMSPEIALKNLKTDAEFYQLGGLVKQCDALITQHQRKVQNESQKSYLVYGCEHYYSNEDIPFAQLVDEAIKRTIWSVRITDERLIEKPFASMERPKDHRGLAGLRTIAAVESFARAALPGRAEPHLIGWHSEISELDYSFEFKLVVVLGN
ncbi:putative BTB domain protein [Rhizoctonia solani 123E]|uniref:Putative BTB domain protein n=1 Tax=Rhizoctonia solani 123E TaxID=1423351 RepID=A0A074RNM3_9AGAM|nr:putative BTB domain protein [Rhizoctonia solani 123E]